jgi:hypothetical protein
MKITEQQQIKFENLVTKVADKKFRGNRQEAIRYLVLEQGVTADKF